MKTSFIFSPIFGAIFLMSPNTRCQPEYKNHSRVIVEGKITSQNAANIDVKLNSGSILISETKSNSDGSFKLGGPGTTAEKELSFDRKIASFTSNETACTLSYDSLAIILPVEKSYFNFAQITFKP
ncbi:hypothetical protein Q73A0000_11320 [Kaistella flava (ex Peng et al. 2021)]|uniref:Uncharacterized protein n=1 Tax=Kaistella flava (ex Peng et al. 2021) TaxID=2038776 RepID=A0A7M2Y9Y2_9FLAO|nr:hypothetical protein [Kaistella flava (ex Peng et al. 2021)]QOW10906.1 hypothetical protein Q73A0000_11320 [Kaistella flava (ex Peng et al. 2021)]